MTNLDLAPIRELIEHIDRVGHIYGYEPIFERAKAALSATDEPTAPPKTENDRTLDALIDYAQHALGDGYPYEVTERDLALTLRALRSYKQSFESAVEPRRDRSTWSGSGLKCETCGKSVSEHEAIAGWYCPT